MKTKTKRFNWRVSEEIAAELNMLRRENGQKSWDEFFQAIIRKLKTDSSVTPLAEPGEWVKFKEELTQAIKSQFALFHGLMEAREEAVQVLCHEQTQTNELVRRFNTLLAITLEIDPKQLDEPGAWSSVMETTPKDDVLNKVRRMRA